MIEAVGSLIASTVVFVGLALIFFAAKAVGILGSDQDGGADERP